MYTKNRYSVPFSVFWDFLLLFYILILYVCVCVRVYICRNRQKRISKWKWEMRNEQIISNFRHDCITCKKRIFWIFFFIHAQMSIPGHSCITNTCSCSLNQKPTFSSNQTRKRSAQISQIHTLHGIRFGMVSFSAGLMICHQWHKTFVTLGTYQTTNKN